MNWDRVEGNWKQFKGTVKQQWGKLTDDQLDVIGGKRDQLAGKIQETYGISKDETDKQIKASKRATRTTVRRVPRSPTHAVFVWPGQCIGTSRSDSYRRQSCC